MLKRPKPEDLPEITITNQAFGWKAWDVTALLRLYLSFFFFPRAVKLKFITHEKEILVVAAVILHGTLHAQHETVNKDLDEVVVTATRKEQKQISNR